LLTNQSGSCGAVFGLGGIYLGVLEAEEFNLVELDGITGIEFVLDGPIELPPCNKVMS
jgi:hypothetical protein